MRKVKVLGVDCFIVTKISDLPILPESIDELFADVETTSELEEHDAFFPHLGDRICGFAFTYDDLDTAYYIPVRHRVDFEPDTYWNVELEGYQEYIRELIKRSKKWINHNVKFDARFSRYDKADAWELDTQLICTLSRSKMIDNKRFNHSLKPLCRSLLNLPMSEETEIKALLKALKSEEARRAKKAYKLELRKYIKQGYTNDESHNLALKKGKKRHVDYADIPVINLGPYAIADVLGNRNLYYHQNRQIKDAGIPAFQDLTVKEDDLTSLLFNIEAQGFKCCPKRLIVETQNTYATLSDLRDKLTDHLRRPYEDTSEGLQEILVNEMELPILGWNEKEDDNGNTIRTPSFDRDALQLYAIHSEVIADPDKRRVVDWIMDYRTEETFRKLFLEPYFTLMEKGENLGLLHSIFTQNVNTGRMAMAMPNGQQLNYRAKGLIVPREDKAFLSTDASQVEFRWIVEYTNQLDAIEAFQANPRLDFHSWAADLAGLLRQEGKTLNFSVAFGAGEKKVTMQLAASDSIINACPEHLRNNKQLFMDYCRSKAKEAYRNYHRALPNIKRFSKLTEKTARKHGRVISRFGRQRHLPESQAHISFNALVQGTAADYVKSRMLALDPRTNDLLPSNGVTMLLQVHDEILLEGPIDVIEDRQFQLAVNEILEENPAPCRVPMKWDMGTSRVSWADCGADENQVELV